MARDGVRDALMLGDGIRSLLCVPGVGSFLMPADAQYFAVTMPPGCSWFGLGTNVSAGLERRLTMGRRAVRGV